jgi:hypothetical protein
MRKARSVNPAVMAPKEADAHNEIAHLPNSHCRPRSRQRRAQNTD